MSFETESRAGIWKERVCSLTEEWKRIDKGGDLRRVTCGKAVVPHDIPVEIWKKNLGAVGFWSRLCDTGLKQISQTMYSRYKRTDEAQLMRAAQLSKQQLEPIP